MVLGSNGHGVCEQRLFCHLWLALFSGCLLKLHRRQMIKRGIRMPQVPPCGAKNVYFLCACECVLSVFGYLRV
jgi:hypothetical protein